MTSPTYETLLALAEAVDQYERRVDDISLPAEPESIALTKALAAYRAEVRPPPLRTRAEVDAEIGAVVRNWTVTGRGHAMDNGTVIKLSHLCAEPTREPEP